MEQPLDTQYLREVLSILKEANVAEFKCAEFTVSFEAELDEEEEEEKEPVSTDVRGFSAPSTDDDDDEDLDSPASMHRRAYMGDMPTLTPKKPA